MNRPESMFYKKGEPDQARPCNAQTIRDYFAFGVSTATGFASLPVLLSSTFFASLTSGVDPDLVGDVTGEPVGLVTGIAVDVGAGVAGGLLGSFVLGSQAPNTAVETAKTDANMNDLLIVFSYLN